MASKDNQNDNEPTSQTENSLMEAVGSSILGAQQTLGTVYSQFQKNAQQTRDMSTGMIQMLEQMFKANMMICSTFKPAGNGNVFMSLIIVNKTKLPATSMTGVLEFESEEVSISYLEANQGRNEMLPLANVFESPCSLMPLTCYTQEIEIRLNEITQCDGSITLTFSNPLSPQQNIELKHTFGLYLIDQFKKEILDDKLDLDFVDRLCYPVAFLRDTFEIKPIIGINYGMCIGLSSPKHQIVCEIINISDDGGSVEVEFTSNSQDLAQNLIKELSILCAV